MKNNIIFFISLFLLSSGLFTLMAQPSNNACSNAIAIPVTSGSCNSIEYTNVGATSVGDPAPPACWSPATLSHTVWFSFVATTADVEISTNFNLTTLLNTQIAVYSGNCGSLTLLACQENINTSAGLLHTNVVLHGLTIGNTYYIMVDGNGTNTGTFGICAQEAAPVSPPLPVQDCETAQFLCSNALSTITVNDGPGGVGLSQTSPSCFGAPGERSSWWYTFTAATSGTLAFTITPTSAIDYDFAVYNTTNGCPGDGGVELECNWSGSVTNGGVTGLGCTDTQCEPTINVVAGQTYTILVDRFTASSTSGFTLNFSGTTSTFASPNPTFTSTTVCVGTATQFTNTTNGTNTYSWNFGDGFTSNLENPSHTYASAGTYNVTLLVTTNPGGCQNQVTIPVTVNPPPTVDAGTANAICSGQCVTLNGSTNAVGSNAVVPFTNSTSYTIPDNNTSGVYSPIAVSGINPSTISSSSIASVCINLSHSWTSDLDIFLQCPDGTLLELSTDNGGSGDNYTSTCFTPTATNIIGSTGNNTAPFTGTYAPEQTFNTLNGCSANGTWNLFVRDDAAIISGTILGWTISFNNQLPAFTWTPTTSMTNSNSLTPSVCPTSTTTYTLTANGAGGCTVTDTVTVVVNPLVTPNFAAVAPICSGAALSALPTTSTNGISGTWSPALNNTATTTYTFTPAAGQCATTATLTITVNPLVTPTFAAVAPICSGAALSALPTTSTNGISGTWSPALNNTATTTYTFTPNAGQCATTATLTITVNPLVTPTFAAVAPICSGAALSALPTTSTNGISGTWSPALNNTATTTYTFTPTAGQCATTATLTITVNPLVTPTFAAVAPICSGAALSALPTTSTNGISGTWSPALNNTATITYTFTPTAGQCATTATLTITVNPLVTPTFAAVAPICSVAALSALPTTSTNGISGTWSPALNNTATTTYTFTPATGQCATTATLTITVNPLVTPTFAAVAPICSGATLSALPTTSTNGISGTWSPALNNTATTTYTFTPTAGQCATTATLTITVNPLVTPTFAAVAPICSGAALSALPTTSTNGISGTWSPALNNTATTTYTFTPAAGQCATTATLIITVNPLVTPTFAAVAPICSGAALSALPTTSTNGISGTWSPALNNTATTTYTFTPAAGQCATTATLTITVNPLVTPTFAAVAPICSGATLSALPTTSTNGISGTWSPALNNTATTTYTFTPTAGQCATTATLTITVNPLVTPTFAAVAPICSGATLSALPTTSTNGISGTWSPALNNTATTTYTFTPAAGQCATTATLTITVNPLVTPTFAAVAPICSGAALSALPTTSTNGISGTWSPALNNTATTTYTFTPNAGQCATTATLTITVNPLVTPTFAAVAPICSGAALSALPTTSTNGISGTWSPALNNTATTTYTFTPTAGQCATTATLTITVNPLVTPTFAAVAPICSGAALSALPTTSTNGISGTWSPALNNTATTTYTFTPAAGQCANTATLTITVNPLVTPTFAAVAPICSVAALSALPTTSTNGISGTWSPALNNTATTTYTFTPTAGQCATTATLTITVNPLVTPTFAAVAPICSGAALSALPTTSTNGISGTWSPALNNTATTTYTFTPTAGQCATTATLTITVNPLVTPTFAAVAPICSGAALSALPTTSTNGISGTWSPALNNTATTTYTFTPAAGQCATTATLTITVNSFPWLNTSPSPLELCDDNNDGFGIFNLSDATAQIVGGTLPPGVSITYHLTSIDAQTGSNALPTVYPNNDPWTQTIYVRVFYTNTGCANYVQLQLIVHPKPEATTPNDYHVCDNDADGSAVFNLNTVIPQVLGTINPATHTVTFHLSESDANNDTGAITTVTNFNSATTTIWIRVENNATGCFDVVPLNLVVDALPLAVAPYIYRKCDYNSPLGYETFNLTDQIPTLLNGQTGMQVIFYPSLADAQNNTNAITTPSAYQNAVIYVQTIGIRIVNTATGCYVVSTLDLYVDQLPTPTPPTAPLTVCDDDQNGWNTFDLCSLDTQIQNGQTPPYILTYHLTLADAQNDINPLGCTYQNNLTLNQTIYVRAEDAATGCYSTLPIQLVVNPSAVMPALNNLQLCDTFGNQQDGCTNFNLTLQTPTVLAPNVPNSNYTVTYYTSQANAEAVPNGLLPIVSTSNYYACNGTTIWVRVENNTTHCFEVGSFQLVVNTPLVLTAPTLYRECDNDSNPNNLYTSFDIMNFVSSSVPSGYTINFYSNALHTLPISSPFTNTIPANQTIYWTATNTATGCVSSATLTLSVIPVPTPRTNPAPIVVCNTTGPNSGCETVNLTQNATYILNNEPNVSLHYYASYADAEIRSNEITTPTTANICGDAYIRVEWSVTGYTDYTNQPCYVIVTQPVRFAPVPAMEAAQTYQECDDDTDGFTTFNLLGYATNAAATPPFLIPNAQITPSNVQFTFYTDAAMTQTIATPSAFTNTINPQPIYVMASHTISYTINGVTVNQTCTATQSFTLTVNPKPSLTAPAAGLWNTCDTDGTNDGYFIRDLNTLTSGILNGQPDTDYTVNYYESEYNPDATPPLTPAPITGLTSYPTHTQTLWISVTNNATGCYRTAPFNIVVEELPEPNITTNFDVLCVDFDTQEVLREVILTANNANTTVPAEGYSYQWYAGTQPILGATQSTYTITDALANNDSQTYYVVMTSNSALGCSTASTNHTITQSGPAAPIDAAQIGYTITNAFSDNQIITVTVDGYGVYEFSLDDGPRQTSNVFENVGLGNHTIYVWDTEGGLAASCDPLVLTNVQTIDYPHYFTPNADGYHDHWNIQGLYNQPDAKIYIFDRYGKLIKQISPQSLGWDGTYNGNPLPASDYWFTVEFNENNSQKQFRAHFTLKR